MRAMFPLTESRAGAVAVLTARGPVAALAFSDREGGVSAAPFDSLNLAITVGDERDRVVENRRRVAAAASFDAEALVLARQVHADGVIEARAGDRGVLGEADILVTSEPGTTLGILTADCAPVILAGDGRVAVVHAGWRGVVAGAVERGLDAVGRVTHAWVGPSIHACCYEVGPEVTEAFRARGLPVAGPTHVDPARAAEKILADAGVPEIEVSARCTSCDRRYFSYRRDGLTGRQGGFVTLLGEGGS